MLQLINRWVAVNYQFITTILSVNQNSFILYNLQLYFVISSTTISRCSSTINQSSFGVQLCCHQNLLLLCTEHCRNYLWKYLVILIPDFFFFLPVIASTRSSLFYIASCFVVLCIMLCQLSRQAKSPASHEYLKIRKKISVSLVYFLQGKSIVHFILFSTSTFNYSYLHNLLKVLFTTAV